MLILHQGDAKSLVSRPNTKKNCFVFLKLIFHDKHTYLQIYYITNTIPQGSIHTTQQIRYPREALQFFAYIPGATWTIQHLTSAFKWLSGDTFNYYYDDNLCLAEIRLIIITMIIYA